MGLGNHILSILFHDSLLFGYFIPEPWLDILKTIDNKGSQGLSDEKTYP